MKLNLNLLSFRIHYQSISIHHVLFSFNSSFLLSQLFLVFPPHLSFFSSRKKRLFSCFIHQWLMIMLDYRVRRENLILIKVHDYIDNYSGEITALCSLRSMRGRKSINWIPVVRRAQYTSVSMMELRTSKSSVIKLNFKGFSRPSIYIFSRIHAISIGGRQNEGIFPTFYNLKRVLLKSCECKSKKPLIYSFYHTKTIFSHFPVDDENNRKKLSFIQSCLKPTLMAVEPIILESMALFPAFRELNRARRGRNLKPKQRPSKWS